MDYHLAKLSGGFHVSRNGDNTQKNVDVHNKSQFSAMKDARSHQARNQQKDAGKGEDLQPCDDAPYHKQEDTEILIPEETKGFYESHRGLVIEESNANLKNPAGFLSNVFDNQNYMMSQPNCLKNAYSHINNSCYPPPAVTIDIPKLYSTKHTNMARLNVPRTARTFLVSADEWI